MIDKDLESRILRHHFVERWGEYHRSATERSPYDRRSGAGAGRSAEEGRARTPLIKVVRCADR